MSGFFNPFPDTQPTPPPGNDIYDVPAPNFRLIGQQLASGIKDAGGLGTQSKASSWFSTDPITAVLTFLARIIAFILAKILCIVAFLMRLISSVDDAAAPGIDEVARASLEHVFGVQISGSGPRKVVRSVDAAVTGAQLGKTITQALSAGATASAGNTLQPGSQGADFFLGQLARIGIEGWIDGMVAEACSIGQLKSLLELVPIMSDVLGFHRLARRVLAAPLKVLIEDPYLWALHLQYRPTLLPEGVAVREFLRGKLTRDQLDNVLGRAGHSPGNIDAFINATSKMLSVGDLDYLVAHNRSTVDTAVQHLKDDGYDETTARTVLNLSLDKRLDVHHQRLAESYAAAFIRGEIDQPTLHNALVNSNMPDGEVAVYEATVVQQRQLNVKHLSLAEVEKLIQAHVMSIDDLRTWMTRENFPAEEQTLLEIYLLGRITSADEAAAAKKAAAQARATAAQARQQKAAAAAQAAALRAQVRGVSLATMTQLVESGQRTFADLRTYLTDLGMAPGAIQDVIDHVHNVMDAKQQAAAQHAQLAAEADVKHVPLSQVEKSVIGGVLTMQDLQNFLVANEYGAADQTLITQYVQAQIDLKASKASAKTAAHAAAAQKGISLPALEHAARLGVTTVAAYSAALDAAGYDPHSRDLLVGILQDQIAADAATLAKRKAAIARSPAGKISLVQLEQAVIDGIKPIADYTAAIAALGYDASDQETLTELLQVRVAHAAAAADKRKVAAARLAQRAISLTELERAVKLGVVPIAVYQAALAAVGFGANDQQILVQTLLAQVAKSSQAAAKRNTVSKQLGKKGISLAQEEQLARDGIITTDAYQQFLTAQGYSDQDSTNLTDLLKLKIAQAQAAAKLHAAAAAKSADREIPIGKMEAAVTDGLRTMDDYRAYLADLGYDAIDTSTLVDVLAAKIAAGRAKAKSAAPPQPAPSPPLP